MDIKCGNAPCKQTIKKGSATVDFNTGTRLIVRKIQEAIVPREIFNESAGKRKSAHINKGNAYLKSMLCEIGWVISSKRTLYLSGWYWRVKQRKGAKRATIALARKLLTLIYTMLKTGEPYNEDCFEQRRKRSERKRASRMMNELQKLGYLVVAPQ